MTNPPCIPLGRDKWYLLSPNVVTGEEFLVKDLTDWVHPKYNSRKILALLQLVHLVGVTRGNSEILEANFTKE